MAASLEKVAVNLFMSFRDKERHEIQIGQLNQLAYRDGKAAQAVFVIDSRGLYREVSWEDLVAMKRDPITGRYVCGKMEFGGQVVIEYFTGLGHV